MQYSHSLAMIVDFMQSAMGRDFKIEGAVAHETEIDDALALRFGFIGDDSFENHGRLEFFCTALNRAAKTVNEAEDSTVIEFDGEHGALFTRSIDYFITLLEVMAEQQNLDWDDVATLAATPLDAAGRKQAETTLRQDPDVLLRLSRNFNGYVSRDALYTAILRETDTPAPVTTPGLYTLDDLRGALRAEAVVEGRARSGAAATFWYH